MSKRVKKDLKDASNPEEFIFHAADEKGHTKTMRVNVPTDLAQMLHQIVQKGHFPYRTDEDVIRDALFHRLAWLNENKDLDLKDYLTYTWAMDAALNQVESAHKFQEWMASLNGKMTILLNDSARQIFLQKILEATYKIRDDYWREQHLSYLKNHYSHLLKRFDMADTEE